MRAASRLFSTPGRQRHNPIARALSQTASNRQQYTELMQLVVEDFESMAPVILNPRRVPMTDDEFVAFCEQYEDFFVECTAEGEIIIMPPNYSRTGKRNMAIGARLWIWAQK